MSSHKLKSKVFQWFVGPYTELRDSEVSKLIFGNHYQEKDTYVS